MRAVGAGRVTPAQPVAIDEHDAAQHPAVIGPYPRKTYADLEAGKPTMGLSILVRTMGERHHAELDDLVLGVIEPRRFDVDEDAHLLAVD